MPAEKHIRKRHQKWKQQSWSVINFYTFKHQNIHTSFLFAFPAPVRMKTDENEHDTSSRVSPLTWEMPESLQRRSRSRAICTFHFHTEDGYSVNSPPESHCNKHQDLDSEATNSKSVLLRRYKNCRNDFNTFLFSSGGGVDHWRWTADWKTLWRLHWLTGCYHSRSLKLWRNTYANIKRGANVWMLHSAISLGSQL